MYNTKKNIRQISFNILFCVFYDNKLLNNAINDEFNINEFAEEDKAFIKRECTGVIEKLDDIDTVINKYSKIKTAKLDNDVLVVLRLAIYELYYMDKVPIFASINEAVNLIKKSKNKALSGYVNAILRNIVRKENINKDNEIPKSDKKCYFKVFHNKDIDVLNELNEKKISFAKYNGSLDFKYAKVYYVNKYKDVIDTNSFDAGDIIIEDASSVHLVDRLAIYIKECFKNKDISILDTCSSPGGKILSLIDLIRNYVSGLYVEARDVSEIKILKIKENAKRLNITNIVSRVKDAMNYDEKDKYKYDIVICDVPCTGLGVVNKKPDIKLNYSDKKRDELVKIQQKILDVSKEYVKTNGLLSYSTCTTTNEENENNVSWFLDNNINFKKMYEKRINVDDGSLADGFYMCIMQKIN